jgi:GWxTD domain-containing protein
MRKIFILFLLLILPFSLFSQMPGKRETRYGFEINVKPAIYFTPVILYQDSSWIPYLNIVLRVQNDLLQFVKEGDQYTAGYEVLLTILNQESDSVFKSEIWRENVAVDDFSKTNAKWVYNTTKKVFEMPDYFDKLTLDIEVTDLGNFQRYRNRRPLKTQHIDKSTLRVSPIVFLETDRGIPSEIHLSSGDPILEFNSNQIARFSVSSRLSDTLGVLARLVKIKDKGKIKVFEKTNQYNMSGRFITVRDTISKTFLEEGTYSLLYEFSQGETREQLEKKFEVIWYNKPIYFYKFDLALRPMRYILSKKQWDEVDDMSYSQQEKWFKEYWKEKDPSPETPFNEIAYEFFSRVDDANREYSLRFIEGWETDRGKALILYGQPDRQEKKTYQTNSKPYEIWFYDSLKQKLTFVDIDNDANYKLVTVEDLTDTENE